MSITIDPTGIYMPVVAGTNVETIKCIDIICKRHELPLHIRVKDVVTSGGIEQPSRITFRPNGSCDVLKITLVDGSERSATVEVGPSYNDVHIIFSGESP